MPRTEPNYSQKNIPPGVYKMRTEWQLLVRHLNFFRSFSPTHFWIGLISGWLRAPFQALSIYVSGLMINSIIDYYNSGEGVYVSSIIIPKPVLLLFAIFGIWVIIRSLTLVNTTSRARVRTDVFSDYKDDVVKKIHALNAQELEEEQIRSELTKIDELWWGSANSLYNRIISLGEQVIAMITMGYAIWNYSPLVAILILFLPIPEVIMIARNQKVMRGFVDSTASLRLARSYYYGTLIDQRTFTERKINRTFEYLRKLYNHFNNLINNGTQRILVKNENQIWVFSVVDKAMLTIARLAVLVWGIASRQMVGTISAGLGYLDSMYADIFHFMENIVYSRDELTYVRILYDFVDNKGFADVRIRGKHLKVGVAPKIELKNLTFVYPKSGKKILENTDLTIKSGEKVLILGKDGSGKSSLLSIISGMYKIQDGQILFNKVPIQSLARGELKNRLSIVSEDFARYYMPIKDNIITGDLRKKVDEKLITKTLEIVGLTEWINTNHIDIEKTSLGTYFCDGIDISSGHWQRIAIARALYRNRSIFLFDQPFTYIDRASVTEIFPKIIKYIGKKTLILIAEEVIFPESFDKIYEMGEYSVKELDSEQMKHWK